MYVGSSAFWRTLGTSSIARICLMMSARRASSFSHSTRRSASSRSESARRVAAFIRFFTATSSIANAGFSRCDCTSFTSSFCTAMRCPASSCLLVSFSAACVFISAAVIWLRCTCRRCASFAFSSASSVSALRFSTSLSRSSSSLSRILRCHASNSDASLSSDSYEPSCAASSRCFLRYRLSSRRIAAELRRTWVWAGGGG